METALFEELCDIAQREAGIQLKEGKEALVTARVAKRLRALGLKSHREYLNLLKGEQRGQEIVRFLDAISTNYTAFMREPDHFDDLARWARHPSIASKRRIRIWCAATASGEEPYTIAMTLLDNLEGEGRDLLILGTDISTAALGRAHSGRYTAQNLAPLSANQRATYFTRDDTDPERPYSASRALRDLIVLRRLNLDRPPYPMRGPLDIVFCRNVMIYFNRRTRQGLVSEIERLLGPGGVLFTGHSETLAGLTTGLRMKRPSVYVKPGTDFLG